MYVVFQNGGKQYKVKKYQVIKLEKIKEKINKEVEFNNIIAVIKNNEISTANINNIKIIGKILEHNREKKIKIIKFKRRKHSKKRYNHRQWFSKIKIIKILEDNKKYGS